PARSVTHLTLSGRLPAYSLLLPRRSLKKEAGNHVAPGPVEGPEEGIPMKKTVCGLLPTIAVLAFAAGSLSLPAEGMAAATEPLTILKPNLKVNSSLSAPYRPDDRPSGARARLLDPEQRMAAGSGVDDHADAGGRRSVLADRHGHRRSELRRSRS